jgi:hypothetical protein
VAATEGVVNLDVNLGPVEGAVSRVELPLVAKGIERRLERLLSPEKVRGWAQSSVSQRDKKRWG